MTNEPALNVSKPPARRTSAVRSLLDLLALTIGFGCALAYTSGCEKTAEPVRGQTGESCQARSDCESSLVCIDNRCLPSGATSNDQHDADAGMSVADTRGGLGESCTRRADCAVGLMCIANVCVESPDQPTQMQSPLGDRGESCQARNDCAAGLVCVMNRCAVGDVTVAVQAKQCFRVQCEVDEDCCANFVAPLNCPTWKTNCASGDTASCNSYNASCVCALGCQNSACVQLHKCSADSECTAFGQRCVSGKCAQCGSDADCTQAGQRCIANICRAGCQRNEQCPLFSECKDSECVQVGCKSDRECYFATKNPLSRCMKSECLAPCESDAQCGDLQACQDKRCQFVGCETDDECRAFLNLVNQTGNDRAVCRLPDR